MFDKSARILWVCSFYPFLFLFFFFFQPKKSVFPISDHFDDSSGSKPNLSPPFPLLLSPLSPPPSQANETFPSFSSFFRSLHILISNIHSNTFSKYLKKSKSEKNNMINKTVNKLEAQLSVHGTKPLGVRWTEFSGHLENRALSGLGRSHDATQCK